jgi:hypothetical protein
LVEHLTERIELVLLGNASRTVKKRDDAAKVVGDGRVACKAGVVVDAVRLGKNAGATAAVTSPPLVNI